MLRTWLNAGVREDVFRPRKKISQCLPYLQEEINVVSPKVIITLGDGAINAPQPSA